MEPAAATGGTDGRMPLYGPWNPRRRPHSVRRWRHLRTDKTVLLRHQGPTSTRRGRTQDGTASSASSGDPDHVAFVRPPPFPSSETESLLPSLRGADWLRRAGLLQLRPPRRPPHSTALSPPPFSPLPPSTPLALKSMTSSPSWPRPSSPSSTSCSSRSPDARVHTPPSSTSADPLAAHRPQGHSEDRCRTQRAPGKLKTRPRPARCETDLLSLSNLPHRVMDPAAHASAPRTARGSALRPRSSPPARPSAT